MEGEREKSTMEDFRSKSCGDGRMQIQSYHGGAVGVGRTTTTTTSSSSTGFSGMQDLRCYSASYAYTTQTETQTQMGNINSNNNNVKFKKGKSANGSISKSWSFNDPELQRKKRVASYKVYTVEGKVKGSLKKSFRWLKERYTRVVYGW